MLVRVFGKIVGGASIKSIAIDSHDIVTTFNPVINNTFEHCEDVVIEGSDDFAFLKHTGCRKYCKSIWVHDTQTSKVVSRAQELPLKIIIGAFERRGEYYVYGNNSSFYSYHKHEDMHLSKLDGSAETLFTYSTHLWDVKPSIVMDYYGEYLYMSMRRDDDTLIKSNIDFVRAKSVYGMASKSVAAYGDSVYWLRADTDNMVQTDWRSEKDIGVPNPRRSMQSYFSETTVSTFISSATYIDDMRFMLHDNATATYKDTHIAIFDLRNLSAVCCGYRVSEKLANYPPIGRSDIYLRNFGSCALGASPRTSTA